MTRGLSVWSSAWFSVVISKSSHFLFPFCVQANNAKKNSYFQLWYGCLKQHNVLSLSRHILCSHPKYSPDYKVMKTTSVCFPREPVDEVLQMPPSLLTCGGCQQSIGDRFFLKAIEQYWHEDCLSCDLCGCRLGEVGRRLYYKLGRKLCRRDYLRSVKTTRHSMNKVL